MGKRLFKISLDQINEPGPRDGAPEPLDSLIVGIALGCASYLLPVALLWIVTFTATDLFLALALAFFIHAEIRHAQGRRRALRTRAELVGRLRQIAPLQEQSRHFLSLVDQVSKYFHQIAFVDIFVAPLVSVGASAAVAIAVESQLRFRLVDIVLPAFACIAATFAWLRIANWQLRSLLPTRNAAITLLLIAMPFTVSAAPVHLTVPASRADGSLQTEDDRLSVAGPDRNSRTIDLPANFGSSAGRVSLESPPRRFHS